MPRPINHNRVKKLSRAEIVEYYRHLAYPEQHPIPGVVVPVDMRLKAFKELLVWTGSEIPPEAKDEPQRFVIEVKQAD